MKPWEVIVNDQDTFKQNPWKKQGVSSCMPQTSSLCQVQGTVRCVFNLKECIHALVTLSTYVYWVLTTCQAVLGTEHTAENLHNCGATAKHKRKTYYVRQQQELHMELQHERMLGRLFAILNRMIMKTSSGDILTMVWRE